MISKLGKCSPWLWRSWHDQHCYDQRPTMSAEWVHKIFRHISECYILSMDPKFASPDLMLVKEGESLSCGDVASWLFSLSFTGLKLQLCLVNYQYHWENIEAQLLYLQNSLVRGRQRSWAWTWTTCHGTRSAPVRGWRNEKVIIWKPMAYCLLVAIPRMARIAPWSSAPSKSTELQGKEVINSMDCKYFKCLRNLNFTCYLFWGLTLEDSPCTKPSPAPASHPP